MISVHSTINIKVLIGMLSLVALCVSCVLGMLFTVNMLLISVSVILLMYIIVAEKAIEGTYLTVGTMFGVFWFFYANAHLINQFSDPSFLSEYNLRAYIAYFLALVAFFIGYRCFPVRSTYIDVKIKGKTIAKLFIIITGVALVLEFYYYVGIIGFNVILRSSRAYIILLTQNTRFSVVFGVIGDFLYLAAPMLYVLYIRTRYVPTKMFAIATVIFNVTMSLIMIDRSNLLFSLLPIGYLLLRDKRVNKVFLAIVGIISFFLLVDFKATMSTLINQGRFRPIQIGIPEEFFGSFEITTHIMRDLHTGNLGFNYGSTYYDTMLAIVFPFMDIEPLSIWYVRTFRYDIFSRGGGLAFSSIAEAYMCLGFVSVFAYYFSLGLFVGLLNRRKEHNDFAMIMYSLILPLAYKLFRSEAYSLLKTGVWCWVIPLLLLSIVYKRIRFNEI